MTDLGKYLEKKSVKKADISRKTGISASRLSELSRNDSAHLKAKELYLISLAIDVTASDILLSLYGHLKEVSK